MEAEEVEVWYFFTVAGNGEYYANVGVWWIAGGNVRDQGEKPGSRGVSYL